MKIKPKNNKATKEQRERVGARREALERKIGLTPTDMYRIFRKLEKRIDTLEEKVKAMEGSHDPTTGV